MKRVDFADDALGILLAAAMLAGCGGHTVGSAVPTLDGSDAAFSHHQTFHFTGTAQSFKAPAGVELINVVALGAGGGPAPYRGYRKLHGRGGRVRAIIPVTPGQTLSVFVGGEGSGGIGGESGGTGFNGGAAGGLYPYCGRSGYKCYGSGGGGASDVRENVQLKNRIIVAGGGGGGSTCDAIGGGGGGKSGGSGGTGGVCFTRFYSGGDGGDGGTQKAGGSGGAGQIGVYGNGGSGSNGTLGTGGNGGYAGSTSSCRSSCFGGGAGGGGGGGFYGGGGGGGGNAGVTDYQYLGGPGGGGGGGSSYAQPSAKNVRMWRNWNGATGNGLVVISW
ncbi:MAG: glycine rich domain-containing protein [Candidatus Cybelea sp.]